MPQQKRLKIELGTTILVTFSGTTLPIKGRFVGLEHGHYLVLRFPAGSGVHDHLYEGNELVARYVHNGKVFGFRSEVIGYMFKKRLMLVVITYPAAFETHQLRKEQRVEFYVPARVDAGEETLEAYVVDLSPNGCRLLLDQSNQKAPFMPGATKQIFLSFPFIGLEGAKQFQCRIKNTTQGQDKSELFLGLEFENVDDTIIETIRGYIQQVAPLFE